MSHTKQAEICQMFDRIAPTYDMVNRILSWGQDNRWRKILALKLPAERELRVLDLATGTADVLLALHEERADLSLWGIDLSASMLALGQEKIKLRGLSQINLQVADACALPFAHHNFDVVTIAFGIRNISNIAQAFAEIKRVLKPQGQVHILEFSLPRNKVIKYCYLAYFRYWLPLVGGFLSGEREAYKYLNRTVENFPEPQIFSGLLAQAGFSNITITPLSYGIATLYSAGIA